MKLTRVEIRVPTYKRPRLLRRALSSVLEQTHTDWRCIVMDDSPQREGEQVCSSLNDDRIVYAPNSTNLGICANLDNACSVAAATDCEFRCVLEDDNYFLPNHLEDSIAKLERSKCDVLMRDQLIERSHDRESPGVLDDRTMYAGQYVEGVLPNSRLFAAFFYSIGATNCGLFWRANAGLDFSTTRFVDEVVWQERLRTLCIDRPVYIAMQPTVVWRDNGGSSARVSPTGLSWYLNTARIARYERRIYRSLYRFLQERGWESLIWTPPCGDFDASRARVFHRVGIRIPSGKTSLPFGEQALLRAKRHGAQLLAVATDSHCAVAFDAVKTRLTAR